MKLFSWLPITFHGITQVPCAAKNLYFIRCIYISWTMQFWFESCEPIVRKYLGQNRWCFVPCDLEIWWITLENNRASLLCCFKLCATFHSHWWIQTGFTVRKRPFGSNSTIFRIEICHFNRALLNKWWINSPKESIFFSLHFMYNRAPLLCYQALCIIS